MLQVGNQHEETATAGKQVTLPAHQKDPKVPPRSKISKFHGVSFNSVTNLWKVFLWDPTKTPREPRKNPGGQWYLGTYDSEEKAAQIHDKAIIKLGRHKGPEGTRTCPLNFPLSTYASDIEEMERGSESTEEYFRRLRASYAVGYPQGQVALRGVSSKANSKKYVATFKYKDSGTKRNLHIYLGSFEDKEEAGKCYDKAALFYKGEAAHTNFPPDSYSKDEIEAYGRMLEAKRQKTNEGLTIDKGIDDLKGIKEVDSH